MPTSSSDSTIDVNALVQYAKQQLGKPYVWAAAGPDTFDCSGLVTYVFRRFGINLPHHAADQALKGQEVDSSAIQAGDLVFSDWGDGPDSHVGIAVSPNQIIDAPHRGEVVRYDNLSSNYRSHITSVRRVANTTGAVEAGGSSTGGSGSTDPGLISRMEGALKTIIGTFTGPYRELAKPLQDIGSAAQEAAAIGDKALKLFAPDNFLRISSGVGGVILVLIGIVFLARAVKE